MSERPRVKQLPDHVANQIAAGEVVARPASVVKELVENALDAGARSIRVEIEGGGVALVRVVDDGCGIHPEDVALALSRHATSKIGSHDDLHAISTLGFRGEALPSIASVSVLTLRTRRAEDDAGTELTVEGGAPPRIAPCGCAPGTTVEVRELFFHVPARRKFLRATATESAHVSDVVRAAALANPGVQFELVRDGRRTRRWLSMPGLAERVRDVLHDEPLTAAAGVRGPISIEAFLSGPERARSGAGGLHLFVNGRPIQDRALARAVASAYGETLARGRYPVGALFVRMPAELVDVNVHPQKAEVRFAHARAMSGAVHAVVSEALLSSSSASRPRMKTPDRSSESWEWRDSGARTPAASQELPAAPPAMAPRLRVLGIVRGALVVCDTPDGLRLIELARARAAELRARAEEELARGGLCAQRLLFPLVRTVEPALAERLEESERGAERLGFDLRRTGPTTIAAHAMPRLFAGGPGERLLDDVLAALRGGTLDEPALVESLAARVSRAEPFDEERAMRLACELDARGALEAATVAHIVYDEIDGGGVIRAR